MPPEVPYTYAGWLGLLFTRAQRFELVSAEFCRWMGRSETQILGQQARIIFASSEDYEAFGPAVGIAFSNGSAYVGEWRFLKADGSTFWGQLRGMPVEIGKPESGTIWTLVDVSDQVADREELEWAAGHDLLTGLANRKLFEQRATKVVQSRPESLPAAIVMIDLDRFKPINDTAGHAAGDAILKLVASAITSKVRGSDLAVRFRRGNWARANSINGTVNAESSSRGSWAYSHDWGSAHRQAGRTRRVWPRPPRRWQ